MNNTKQTLVAFDIDGTLYDCTDAIITAFSDAVNQYNILNGTAYAPPEPELIIGSLGMPIYEFYPKIFSFADQKDMTELAALSEEMLNIAVTDKKGRIYPYVREVVENLHASGFTISAASNGSKEYVSRVLSAYELDSFFEPLISIGDDGIVNKNDILKGYLKDKKYNKVYMVGDRDSDRIAARANGAQFVYCNYGHSGDSEVSEFDYEIHSLSELSNIIK